ncbi:MAG: ATP-binding cassette domain-containing protein [Lachnospiraceae bacterium]|nr:ATP-binding cassette domain-containing protein [Lachnospiraceae bacterium]
MNKLEIEKLTKHYKNVTAIDDFSQIFTDGCWGLLGPNGAGKSTLMRILSKVISANNGKVVLNGTDINEKNGYLKNISYMPQNFGFYPFFTAKEILEYFSLLKGVKKDEKQIDNLLELVNLSDVKERKVKTFSGGMVRRLGIAVAYLNDAKLLILDEPTAGLDPKERFVFKKTINEMKHNRIIIVSTHIVSELTEMCDNICFLNRGKLIRIVSRGENNDFEIDLEQEYIKMVNGK